MDSSIMFSMQNELRLAKLRLEKSNIEETRRSLNLSRALADKRLALYEATLKEKRECEKQLAQALQRLEVREHQVDVLEPAVTAQQVAICRALQQLDEDPLLARQTLEAARPMFPPTITKEQ